MLLNPQTLRRILLLSLLLPATLHASGSSISYYNSKTDAVAACNSDAIAWTGCTPNVPAYLSWCNTYSLGHPATNVASYSRVIQQYNPVAPYYQCTNAITTYAVYAWPTNNCLSGTDFVGPGGSDCLTPARIQTVDDAKKQIGTGTLDSGICPSSPSTSTLYGNPCDASTGNKLQIETDFAGGDGIPSFTRTYNSFDISNSASFGVGWTHNQLRFLDLGSGTLAADTLTVVRGDGQRETFTSDGAGGWVGEMDTRRRITQSPQGYKVDYPLGNSEFYSPDGRLLTDTDRFGRVTTYGYSGNLLVSITGPYGHKITLTGRTNGFQVTFPNTRSVIYTTDGNYNLATIQYPDGGIRNYKYENTALPHALTGIVDELGVRISTYTFDAASTADSSGAYTYA